jgi:sugar O-acyltransferase (sialic acid O-acetyltransferase NeuD family)
MSETLIIVGTGGFAAEVTEYICSTLDYRDDYLKGYLDFTDENLGKYKFDRPILGTEKTYHIEEDDRFIVAVGKRSTRNKIIDILRDRGAKFINVIHSSAIVSKNAKIGEGNIICPFCVIGPNAVIGDNNIFNCHTYIAHDVRMGSNNVLCPRNVICGNVEMGDSNFLATAVSVAPQKRIGSNNTISIGMDLLINISDCFLVESKMEYYKTRKVLEVNSI